jgi:hypothetical protein
MKVDLSGDMNLGIVNRFRHKNRVSVRQAVRPKAASNTASSKVQFAAARRSVRRPGVPARFPHSCTVSGLCGEYSVCGDCRRHPDNYDNLSADELRYIAENTTNPELMGAAFSKLKAKVQQAKSKVQAVKKNVVTKLKSAPKPLKALAAIAAAPLMIAAAPVLAPKLATGAAIKLAASKKARIETRDKFNQVKGKVKAAVKKAPMPLKVAAGLMLAPLAPGLASKMATGAGIKTLADKKKRAAIAAKVKSTVKAMPKPLRVAAGIALAPLMPMTAMTALTTAAAAAPIAASLAPGAIAAKVVQKKREERLADQAARIEEAESTGVPQAAIDRLKQSYSNANADMDRQTAVVSSSAVNEANETGMPVAAAATPPPEEQPEQKKSGLSSLLPLAAIAAAIPFFL